MDTITLIHLLVIFLEAAIGIYYLRPVTSMSASVSLKDICGLWLLGFLISQPLNLLNEVLSGSAVTIVASGALACIGIGGWLLLFGLFQILNNRSGYSSSTIFSSQARRNILAIIIIVYILAIAAYFFGGDDTLTLGLIMNLLGISLLAIFIIAWCIYAATCGKSNGKPTRPEWIAAFCCFLFLFGVGFGDLGRIGGWFIIPGVTYMVLSL